MLRLCAALLFISVTACVDDTSSSTQASSDPTVDSGHPGCPPPPPEEAFTACDNSTAGAACAFDINGHHIDGTCKNGPGGNGPLACAPNNPPPPPPPPQESIDACASSTAGATCAFDIDSHHVTGTCKNGPDGNGMLGCAPDQPPPGGCPPPPK